MTQGERLARIETLLAIIGACAICLAFTALVIRCLDPA